MARDSFAIGPVRVRAGAARDLELPITRLISGADVGLPVRVLHGREDGPVVWVNAATHGDEVVGVEVIRRLLTTLSPKQMRGTLIAVPVLNVLGVMTGERYLPDRRDLNRSFPGSARGSLASRIAHLFMTRASYTGTFQRVFIGDGFHARARKPDGGPAVDGYRQPAREPGAEGDDPAQLRLPKVEEIGRRWDQSATHEEP